MEGGVYVCVLQQQSLSFPGVFLAAAGLQQTQQTVFMRGSGTVACAGYAQPGTTLYVCSGLIGSCVVLTRLPRLRVHALFGCQQLGLFGSARCCCSSTG
jgi:hypothetical protein